MNCKDLGNQRYYDGSEKQFGSSLYDTILYNYILGTRDLTL
jgi:hypothetical protein